MEVTNAMFGRSRPQPPTVHPEQVEHVEEEQPEQVEEVEHAEEEQSQLPHVQMLRRFMKVSEETLRAGREYRALTAEKDSLQTQLVSILEQEEPSVADVDGNTFSLKTNTRKNTLTVDIVKTVLHEWLPERQANDLLRIIDESRGSTEKTVLAWKAASPPSS